VYIDECHAVIKRDERITTILDQCRAQKIALILAHQRIRGQIESDNVVSALTNCAIRFANSDEEANHLAPILRTTPELLQSLPKGRFAAFVRGLTPQAVTLTVPYTDPAELPQLTPAEQRALAKNMQRLYGSGSELSEPIVNFNARPPEMEPWRLEPTDAPENPPPQNPKNKDRGPPLW
jgi:hypothetical protein